MALVPLFVIIAVHCAYFPFFLIETGAVVVTYKQVWPPLGASEAFLIPQALKCGMPRVCLAACATEKWCSLLFAREVDALEW